MSIKVAFIIDQFDQIKPHKDSSVAMMLEAQRRGWEICCLLQQDLKLVKNTVVARVYKVELRDQANWINILSEEQLDLSEFQAVFMRKDPPIDMNYMYTTYLLELLQHRGVQIINDPKSLRDVNEKLFTAWFPQCCVETLVSSAADDIRRFLAEIDDIIIKPLGAMGGQSVFRIKQGDPNTNVIIETLTNHGRRLAMVQRFITEINQGDKRLILVDGEVIPYALARIPKPGETRGNLAAGARAEGRALNKRDHWLCEQVAPKCRELGLVFVGLDVIGDFITEINVTSPTGIRELDQMYKLNISAQLMDCIENRLSISP